MTPVRDQHQHGHRHQHQRGFTYLWLLFALALGAATLAAIGERVSTTVLREREAELNFRGMAIATAISAYWAAGANAKEGQDKLPQQTLPASLEDLLEDRRGPVTRRHLRQLYADPHTGLADWVLIRSNDAAGLAGIAGVRSRGSAVAFKTANAAGATAGAPLRVSDRVFKFSPTGGVVTEIDPQHTAAEGSNNAPT